MEPQRLLASARVVYVCLNCPWASHKRPDAAAHQLAAGSHRTERLNLRLLSRGRGKRRELQWATRWTPAGE